MNVETLKKIYEEFKAIKPKYQKMNEYYEGKTDAMIDYKMLTERSNNKAHTNFIQNFIDEEVSYSVGNEATYISKSGDTNITQDIEYYLGGLSEAHDINLLEKMLVTSIAYEIYYIDKNGDFAAKVISAKDGYAVTNDDGSVRCFIRQFTEKFDDKVYLDVYDSQFIYHYDDKFNVVKPKDKHIFREVPVGIATYNIDEDNRHKTIYSTIKGLQDAYETMLSDSTNEVSDFRNAYLKFIGVAVDEEDLNNMKELGAIQMESGEVEWLIKNINDTFVQNTLTNVEEKMYQLTKHINHNDKVVSATSGQAIKARMLGLQQKCKLNQKALEDCIKIRLRMLFTYLKTIKNNNYDYRDVTVVFSANLPSDDVLTANMLAQLGDKISLETGLSQLSFIENARAEIDRIKAERLEFGDLIKVAEIPKMVELAKNAESTEATELT